MNEQEITYLRLVIIEMIDKCKDIDMLYLIKGLLEDAN